MKKKALVSIIMPVKNEAKYIREAVKSVINQSYSNFELIIIDDNSTDETIKCIKPLSDDRIKILQNSSSGKNAAFNLGFKHINGDFVCFFAGDDIMEHNSLEVRIKPLIGVEGNAASTSKVRMISKIKKFNNVINPKNAKKGTMLGGTLMLNKKIANMIFPLPEILPNEDKWTVEHINHFSKIFHVPLVSLNYRIHENNSSSRTNPFFIKTESMHKRFIVWQLFLEKYRLQLSDKQINKLDSLAAAETLRYQNNWISIIFMSNLSVAERARFFFHSCALLYWIRIQLFSFLSGRS